MKVPMWVYHEQYPFNDEGTFAIWHIDIGEEVTDSRIRILLRQIEVDIPDDILLLTQKEVKVAMVAGLQEYKKKLQADLQVKLQGIDDRIQQLQALEYHSAPFDDDIPF